MSELEDPRPPGAGGEGGDGPAKADLTTRLLLRESLTARRAAAIIAMFTLLITIVGGILVWLIDRQEYATIGKGLWFALQTVTTVGYGDVTPKNTSGRVIGAVVMLTGIAFLAVLTASVTASLIEASRRRVVSSETQLAERLDEVNGRLVRIEASLGGSTPSGSSNAVE